MVVADLELQCANQAPYKQNRHPCARHGRRLRDSKSRYHMHASKVVHKKASPPKHMYFVMHACCMILSAKLVH